LKQLINNYKDLIR